MVQRLRKQFDTKEPSMLPTTFTGSTLRQDKNGINSGMQTYIDSLELLSKNAPHDAFASLRARLLWLANARPDIAAAVSMLSSVTADRYDAAALKSANELVMHVQDTRTVSLKYPKLEPSTLHLLVYSDASFANRPDRSSQLGYLILLADASGNCAFIQWSSHKARRVTRSSMASEVLAFTDGLDAGYILKMELERMLGSPMPLLMLTDSQALFDVISKNLRTTERRLELDILAARKAYAAREMNNILLIDSSVNPADGLTKLKPNDALILLMRCHRVCHPVKQFIVSGKAGLINP
jgi:hypothetical protein